MPRPVPKPPGQPGDSDANGQFRSRTAVPSILRLLLPPSIPPLPSFTIPYNSPEKRKVSHFPFLMSSVLV